eukprot:ANDGO_00439.mRNA.1 hypothetical protein PTSG_08234
MSSLDRFREAFSRLESDYLALQSENAYLRQQLQRLGNAPSSSSSSSSSTTTVIASSANSGVGTGGAASASASVVEAGAATTAGTRILRSLQHKFVNAASTHRRSKPAEQWRPISAYAGHTDGIWDISFCPSPYLSSASGSGSGGGLVFATASADRTVRIWSYANTALLSSISLQSTARSVAFYPSAALALPLMAVGCGNGAVSLVRLGAGAGVGTATASAQVCDDFPRYFYAAHLKRSYPTLLPKPGKPASAHSQQALKNPKDKDKDKDKERGKGREKDRERERERDRDRDRDRDKERRDRDADNDIKSETSFTFGPASYREQIRLSHGNGLGGGLGGAGMVSRSVSVLELDTDDAGGTDSDDYEDDDEYDMDEEDMEDLEDDAALALAVDADGEDDGESSSDSGNEPADPSASSFPSSAAAHSVSGTGSATATGLPLSVSTPIVFPFTTGAAAAGMASATGSLCMQGGHPTLSGLQRWINDCVPAQPHMYTFSLPPASANRRAVTGVCWHAAAGFEGVLAVSTMSGGLGTGVYGLREGSDVPVLLSSHSASTLGADCFDIACHATQPLIAPASSDGRLLIFDIRSASEKAVSASYAHAEEVNSVAFFPRVESLVATASEDQSVKLWDMRSTRAPLCAFHFSSAANRIGVAANGMIAVPTDRKRTTILAPSAYAAQQCELGAAQHKDGSSVSVNASGSGSGTGGGGGGGIGGNNSSREAAGRNGNGGRMVAHLEHREYGHAAPVMVAKWTPDGSAVVSAAFDGSCIAWANDSLGSSKTAKQTSVIHTTDDDSDVHAD